MEKREKRHQQILKAYEVQSNAEKNIKVNKSARVSGSMKEQKKRANKVTLQHYENLIHEKEAEIMRARQAQSSVANDYVALQAQGDTLKQLESELEELMEKYFDFLT